MLNFGDLSPEHDKLLRENGWLATCNPEFCDTFLRLGKTYVLEPEERLYKLGHRSTFVYGLVDGQIDIHLVSSSDDKLVFPFSAPGKWYGLSEVLTGELAFASAVARTTSLTLRISRTELQAFVDEDAKRYRDIMAHETSLRRQLQETVVQLVTKNGVDLVGRRLAWMMEAERSNTPTGLDITQSELAAAMGLSVPTVQRAFKELKRKKLITTDYGRVVVPDPGALDDYLATMSR